MEETKRRITKKELLETIDKLTEVDVISIDPPYQMAINDPLKPELVSNFKDYFNDTNQIIPKRIHQVWIGPNPPPWKWINSFKVEFMKLYPDWEYKLWLEEDIAKLKLVNRSLYDAEEVYCCKVDILRYEILYQFGGTYIDADSEWLNQKPLHDLIEQTNNTGMFAGREDDVMVANGVIGCSKNNPIMYYVVKLLSITYNKNRILERRPAWIATGPRYFSEVVLDCDITVFPQHYFYPLSWTTNNIGVDTSQFTDSYMMQYGYSSNEMLNV